ncbi:MAG: GNAT family N-acetyltransferase [Patescibacteria group bacterium]
MRLKQSRFTKPYAIKFEMQERGTKAAWGYLYLIFQDRHREPYGLMENIYVQPQYRNRGLGTTLVERIIQEAQKRKCYKLIGTSKAANAGAHRFYARFGFKKVGYEFRMDLKKSDPLQRD